MLAEQRRAHIMELIRRNGAVRVSDLVRDLDVSDMTIRRDLGVLAAAGLVLKVHGGATRVADSASYEPSFAAKSSLQQAEKRSIAATAARLVTPGMAIAMSAGTTTNALAAELVDVPGLTVVTNSLHISEALHLNGRPDQTVLLTGGLRTPSDALVGPMAVAALSSIHVDLVFMGVHGMTLETGFTTPNLLEADTDRALIAAGRTLVVVADHTKWGVVGISSIARLDEADVLITDDKLDGDAAATLEGCVGRLVVVPAAADDSRSAG
jgi:DeoR/GlpR family transcriptional regulator of sugar metabolism